jgi:hypothetical protein
MAQDTPSPLAPTRKRQRSDTGFGNKSWTHEEDHQLFALVGRAPTPDWSEISRYFPDKSELQVAERWTKVLDPSLLKGSWTRHEDQTIIDFVTRNGTKSWARLSALLPGRIGKQCRERWFNALDPAMNRGPWTPEEDSRLIELHAQHGNRWTKISELMPTRSDNAIKNRWHSTLSKRAVLPTPAPTPARPPRSLLPSIALLLGNSPDLKDLQSLTVGAERGLPELQAATPRHEASLNKDGGLAVERALPKLAF